MRILGWQISAIKVAKGESVVFLKTKDPKLREKLLGLVTGDLAIYKKRKRKQGGIGAITASSATGSHESQNEGLGA